MLDNNRTVFRWRSDSHKFSDSRNFSPKVAIIWMISKSCWEVFACAEIRRLPSHSSSCEWRTKYCNDYSWNSITRSGHSARKRKIEHVYLSKWFFFPSPLNKWQLLIEHVTSWQLLLKCENFILVLSVRKHENNLSKDEQASLFVHQWMRPKRKRQYCDLSKLSLYSSSIFN